MKASRLKSTPFEFGAAVAGETSASMRPEDNAHLMALLVSAQTPG